METQETVRFKILHDTPSQDPALYFKEYAKALREIVMASNPRFAVGVFGGWGSGKTTLMREILRQLKEEAAESAIPVWFSAWRYEKEQHLIIPLLDTIREALVAWSDERRRKGGKLAIETAKTVGKVIHSLLAGVSFKVGLPGALDLSFDANKALADAAQMSKQNRDVDVPRSFYHAAFVALKKTFDAFCGERSGRRLVVFIDDLDRCLPEGALQVLESMKLFFDLKGFVFIVGLDREVVEAIIDSKYTREHVAQGSEMSDQYRVKGSEYIKKIFQVPFSLRPVASGKLDDFLIAICNDAELDEKQRKHLKDIVRPHLSYLLTSAGLNPREIKRYINAYILQLKTKDQIEAEGNKDENFKFNSDVALALQTIDFRADWQTVRKALYAYRGLFFDTLRRQVNGKDTALAELNPSLSGIPTSFLEYVRAPEPGQSMLKETSIDRYIYAGQAARSTLGPDLPDLVRDVAAMRASVRDAADINYDADPVDTSILNKLSTTLNEIKSRISSLATSAGPMIHPIPSLVDEMIRDARLPTNQAGNWNERRERWFESYDQKINQIIDRFAELIQAT